MTRTERAVLARYADAELLAIAQDLCAAASVALAAGRLPLAERLVDDAEEILEFRAGAAIPRYLTDDHAGRTSSA